MKKLEISIAIVKIGKYKGQSFTVVPYQYAEWQRMQGNLKFYKEYLENSRFNKHTNFQYGTSSNGLWLECKLENNNYIFSYKTSPKEMTKFYLVDGNGNYLRDLVTFGSISAKQGAIDQTEKDWITLTPLGQKIMGKMLISPYWEHFPYETYVNQI